jgi:hypothetical protein
MLMKDYKEMNTGFVFNGMNKVLALLVKNRYDIISEKPLYEHVKTHYTAESSKHIVTLIEISDKNWGIHVRSKTTGGTVYRTDLTGYIKALKLEA